MPITETEPRDENGQDADVFRWRQAVLLRAGYDEDCARGLAGTLDVDLHRAVDLVRAGCPPELAYRIFA